MSHREVAFLFGVIHMAEEVTELEVQEVQDAVTPQGDDGFESAFDAAKSGEEVVAPKSDPEPVVEKAEEPEVPPKPTVEELFAQMRTEFYQELGKVRDTAAGRVGELNQRMQQMLSQQRSTGGSGVTLSKDSMKRLSGEFPEIAEMLAEDLSEALKGVGGGPQVNQEEIDRIVLSRVENVRDGMSKDMERFKIGVLVPDWESIVGLPDANGQLPETEYRRWLKTKPLDYQSSVSASWNAREIADSINLFRKEVGGQDQQAQQRKKRFEDAVAPTQAKRAAPMPSTEDDFEAGFRKVKGL